MFRKLIHQMKVTKHLVDSGLQEDRTQNFNFAKGLIRRARQCANIEKNGVADEEAHYDIDGVSFQQDCGVVVSSDQRPQAAQRVKS